MGIRPSMATIFGVNNFEPNEEFLRFRREECEEFPADPNDGDKGGVGQSGMFYDLHTYNPKTKVLGKKSWCDIIWYDSEFGEPNVIGYILSELPYDSDVVRAMSLIDDKYFRSGHTVVPATAKRQMRSRYSGKLLDVLPQHRYGQSYFDEVEHWIMVTRYLFREMKIEGKYLAPGNMKWMLVWQWS